MSQCFDGIVRGRLDVCLFDHNVVYLQNGHHLNQIDLQLSTLLNQDSLAPCYLGTFQRHFPSDSYTLLGFLSF
ncbi:uncharacterized protein L3040_002540 [Drepanopeziza brunnea f. sp. 'multigermtubi']|uniref:uncharacterized protein n=1 Tax=Drepanopeziza brunnea f. sp. 'multigermtubi' TaxID=698441 RepID=UPI00238B85B9|nr:hypothetical protein L3040_002540 [Drepanopeziza brunnea f. sp. 'multigermtubi']